MGLDWVVRYVVAEHASNEEKDRRSRVRFRSKRRPVGSSVYYQQLQDDMRAAKEKLENSSPYNDWLDADEKLGFRLFVDPCEGRYTAEDAGLILKAINRLWIYLPRISIDSFELIKKLLTLATTNNGCITFC